MQKNNDRDLLKGAIEKFLDHIDYDAEERSGITLSYYDFNTSKAGGCGMNIDLNVNYDESKKNCRYVGDVFVNGHPIRKNHRVGRDH